jgi:hypothetical protein
MFGPLLSHPVTLRTRRIIRAVVVTTAILLAVAVVTTITVDLGPAARIQAEKGLSALIQRPSHIGRLKIYLWRGQYAVEDLVIEGATPQSRPFLRAKEITVSMPWSTLWDRRIVLDAINMRGWDMYVELTPDGSNFPKFPKPGGDSKKRFTTTLQYVHAFDGQFTFEDHETPWAVIARNLDVTVSKPSEDYRGQAKFSNGIVTFQQYVPFRVDMDSTFQLDGGLVKFDRLDLESEGAKSHLTGVVDLGNFPEQTYQVRSHIDFPTQKRIWFARDKFTVAGTGDFTGTFHMFKEQMPDGHTRTGRELRGAFTSPLAGVNAWRFANLRGQVHWVPETLEITEAATSAYGGNARFEYRMGPFGTPGVRARAQFDALYQNVDLTALSDHLELQGIRLAGRISGRNLLEWPLGDWSQHTGGGEIHGVPPAGQELMSRTMPVERIQARTAQGKPFGPFSAHTPIEPVAVGGDLQYTFGPEWVDVAPSSIATADTYVELQGRTAYGDRSMLNFHVSSADWQESDRVFAGVLTAFGSSTGAIDIGGYGTFDGMMLNSFRDPRIEGTFAGEQMRAFDIVWGAVRGDAAIENSYADVKNATVQSEDHTIQADGRFSLGFPRRDDGEELNAHVRLTSWPVGDLRHAFGIDEYQLDGLISGDFMVNGHYQTPLGSGRMTIAQGVAYGEPFEHAEAGVRLESDGVHLEDLQLAKSTGRATGAAFVGWNGTYSFIFDARAIPLESVAAVKASPLPLSGLFDFTAQGSASFDSPRYEVHGHVRDLFAADEGIGEVFGDLTVNNRLVTLTRLEASGASRLQVSGRGQIEMTPEMDANLSFNVIDTSLDPYVRALQPSLSPYTTAVVSGSIDVVGSLADIDQLRVDARVDKLDARLFDYQVRNEVPIRLALDRHTVRVVEMRLVGEGTQLDVSGTVGLHEQRVNLRAKGDANVAVLQGFVRNVRSSGRAVLDASLQGSLSDPGVSGTLTIDNARIRHFALPHALENINGALEFDSRGLTLDGLTARLGGGPVQFFGRINKEGYKIGGLDVTMTGQNMHLRFPEGMRSTVDAKLFLQGTADNAILSGDVYVSDALYTKGFSTSGGSLLDLTASSAAGAGGAPGATLPLRYDVEILAPATLRLRNGSFRLLASADLKLIGTYDRPNVSGRAEVNSGDVIFEGKRYLVTRGTIDFNNPTRIQPYFDVEATTRVRVPGETYIVTMTAAGSATDRLAIELNSDPPLPQPQILALLFSDVAPGQDVELRQYSTGATPQQQLVQERAARAITDTIFANEVNRAAQQTFGVDTLQITPSLVDPTSQSARLDPGARLTIGKRLSDRAYLTYARSLTSATRDEIIVLEYDQTDRFSWILSRNEDQTYALEIRVRHTF